MPFEKGNTVGVQFKKGPDPRRNVVGKRPGCTNLSTRALQEVMAVAERVLRDPEALQQWEDTLRETWRTDPWKVWRWLVQVMPRESISISTDEATGLSSYTVKRLRSIANLDDDTRDAPVIDVTPSPEAEDAS